MGDGGGGGGGAPPSFAWDDKGYTHRGAGPGLSEKPLHNNPPPEKFPVPRTWCVRLEGNNSSAPLTSSFGLVLFMTPALPYSCCPRNHAQTLLDGRRDEQLPDGDSPPLL